MRRYTTPTFRIFAEKDLIDNLWFTISTSKNKEIITKELKDMANENNYLTFTLTQEETSLLPKNEYIKYQVRVLYKNGTCEASKIYSMNVEDVLKEGIIE